MKNCHADHFCQEKNKKLVLLILHRLTINESVGNGLIIGKRVHIRRSSNQDEAVDNEYVCNTNPASNGRLIENHMIEDII